MIGILVISHGEMSAGMLDTVQMIVGPLEQVEARSLLPNQDIDQFGRDILDLTIELDQGDGVLVFTDMFGASPYRVAVANSRQLTEHSYKIISGVNLPLLIEAITRRETEELAELYQTLLAMKAETISGWSDN